MMDVTALRIFAAGAGLSLIGAATLAAPPRALAPATGGWWQIAYSARGAPRHGVCLADPLALGQWEHRGQRCSRTILSNRDNRTVLTYTCAQGSFGRSEVSLITPRTIRVATQGISEGGPFNYVIHARRTGNCPPRENSRTR